MRKKYSLMPKSFFGVLIAGLIIVAAFLIVNGTRLKIFSLAAGSTYYMAPAPLGNDANAGTAAAPWATFDYAIGRLTAGDTLLLKTGVYAQPLIVTKSGVAGSPIMIKAEPGHLPVIDLNNTVQNGIRVSGNYITVSGIEVRNIKSMCVLISGSYVNASKLKVHDCFDHGVQVSGKYVNFTDSVIYLASLMNKARTISGGWQSGFKVREGEYVIVARNTIYGNYGEGIGIRGRHVKVLRNKVYDNYSVNIYVDNSSDVNVEGNMTYCSNNSEFFRDAHCAHNISLAEEFYTGWGSNLSAVKIINNIIAFGYRNINYDGHEVGVLRPGIKGALIANNTLYGSIERGMVFVAEPYTSNVLIYNNIVHQGSGKFAKLESRTGITIDYNFWVGTFTSPVLINATGPHDLRGAVGFATTPVRGSSNTFKLLGTSRAVNSGLFLAKVTKDYDLKLRNDGPLDMGAFEYGATYTAPEELDTW